MVVARKSKNNNNAVTVGSDYKARVKLQYSKAMRVPKDFVATVLNGEVVVPMTWLESVFFLWWNAPTSTENLATVQGMLSQLGEDMKKLCTRITGIEQTICKDQTLVKEGLQKYDLLKNQQADTKERVCAAKKKAQEYQNRGIPKSNGHFDVEESKRTHKEYERGYLDLMNEITQAEQELNSVSDNINDLRKKISKIDRNLPKLKERKQLLELRKQQTQEAIDTLGSEFERLRHEQTNEVLGNVGARVHRDSPAVGPP